MAAARFAVPVISNFSVDVAFTGVAVKPAALTVEATKFSKDWLVLFVPMVCSVRPLAIDAHPVALPLARMPVGAEPVEQSVGVPDSAAAVAADPVVF